MGDFPWMTDWGTFIINGTERVVVTQLVRSPGAYVMEPKDREKQVFIANLMPARGSWMELEIDKKGKVFVRIDRKRKLPVTVLLRAMGYVEDDADPRDVRQLALHPQHARGRHRGHEDRGGRPDRAVQEAAPGRAAVGRQRPQPAEPLFFDPKRYDLTRVGRYKLNSRLRLDEDLDTRVLTHRDIIELIQRAREPAARAWACPSRASTRTASRSRTSRSRRS